jgi:uncharacterized protein YbbC (DUF1343 family)
VYVEVIDRNALEPARSGVAIAWILKKQFGEQFQFSLVDKMLQNTAASAEVNSAKQIGDLPAAWESGIAAFRVTREKYLLYVN